MKRFFKAIPCILLLCTMLFTACDERTNEIGELSIAEIADAVKPLIDHPESLVTYDTDQIQIYLELPERYCRQCVVMAQSRADSVDEFGIFLCCNAEDAEALEALIEEYLRRTIRLKLHYLNECLNQSNPIAEEEKTLSLSPLIGSVRRYGTLVCYSILSQNDAAFQNKLKSLLNETNLLDNRYRIC